MDANTIVHTMCGIVHWLLSGLRNLVNLMINAGAQVQNLMVYGGEQLVVHAIVSYSQSSNSQSYL